MMRFHASRLTLGIATAALTLPLSLLLGRGTGVVGGEPGVPKNFITGAPGCNGAGSAAGCHGGFASIAVKLALTAPTSVQKSTRVPITFKVSGANSSSTRGGFAMEASAGTFVPGMGMRVGTGQFGRSSITHTSSLSRSWTFALTAPSKTGIVELWALGNAVNGNGRSSGDQWGWYGPDPIVNGVPFRLFVNDDKVFPFGTSCSGTKGFKPVIGMPKNAAIGTSFQTEVHNIPPATATVGILGLSNRTWGAIPLPLPLTGAGATGCSLSVSMDVLQPAVTTGAGAGGGVGKHTWSLPNVAAFRGINLFFQAMTIDKSANALGLTFSEGLRAPIQ